MSGMLKKGDTVWFIDTCWTAESVGAQYVRMGTVVAANGFRYVILPFRTFSNNEIGKLVFHSQYEAETALRNSIRN